MASGSFNSPDESLQKHYENMEKKLERVVLSSTETKLKNLSKLKRC